MFTNKFMYEYGVNMLKGNDLLLYKLHKIYMYSRTCPKRRDKSGLLWEVVSLQGTPKKKSDAGIVDFGQEMYLFGGGLSGLSF